MKKLILLIIILWPLIMPAQNATEIIKKADQKMRGKSSYAEMTIKIIRPKWQREMRLKSWTKGTDYAVSVITYPPKEKGIVFLKRQNELWQYIPSINRKIKMPPSMMLQSWMGTDLTNDDLIKESSIVNDYHHKIIGEDTVKGLKTWKILLTPKEDAPVVWGKIVIWIDQKDYMQMKAEFYDEDGFLVNKMLASEPKIFDGKRLPSKISFIPVDKPGHQTMIIYNTLKFDIPVNPKIFSPNYMTRFKI